MYYFIVNPKAKSGYGIKLWQNIQTALIKKQIEYRVMLTTHPGHATLIMSKLSESIHKKTIIILGGDGTLNEAMNGLYNNCIHTIGYIPTGSSNDFARGLGLRTDAIKALTAILGTTKISEIDFGILNYAEDSQRRFMVSAGIGFDASICHEALTSKTKKVLNQLKLGKLSYTLIALRQLITLKPVDATLLLDDRITVEVADLIFLSAHIQPYEGGGFKFCKDADPTDQLLDLCVANHISKWRLLCMLPFARKGTHTRFKGISTYRCQQVSILTKEPLHVHTDGESCGKLDQLLITSGDSPIRIINSRWKSNH